MSTILFRGIFIIFLVAILLNHVTSQFMSFRSGSSRREDSTRPVFSFNGNPKKTDQSKPETGDTSFGGRQIWRANTQMNTGFPENNWNRNRNVADRRTFNFRNVPSSRSNPIDSTSSRFSANNRNRDAVSTIQLNNERIRKLEADRRRIIEQNIRDKYQKNDFLKTRGLISGVRLPTRSQTLSRDPTPSDQNQILMSPDSRSSNQNRQTAFARRQSRRPVLSLASSPPNDQHTVRSRTSTDRQSARDQLERVSVPRSEGANNYLKQLLYRILRRVDKN
ncbi:uncharacterized protein LOC133180082 [Saccostrea echinata]|uniref:uncharacterized protein LOC133180082 n=1 Tax=Saccostrea echinata TaxID=191078 RepID=UPI002A829E52|nr:uncharacterized protein LOC133180082 [Saccostrea echinata]